MDSKKTSWDDVGEWYHELLGQDNTYQKNVILPNIIRLLDIKNGETILDMACGEGFFSREYEKRGAKVVGGDISSKLIKIARENSPKNIKYEICPADNFSFIENASIDKITIILAIQNIENIKEVFRECGRVLKRSGRLLMVLNHPAFRIPKKSFWGYDTEKNIQYRRIDGYLSESGHEIEMEPGRKNGEKTVSFHRPLQTYFKYLSKEGFAVSKLEEWTSDKKSKPGPKASAENRARKEIPLFMVVEAVKIITD